MNKFGRITVISLLLLAGLAFIVVPMLRNTSTLEDDKEATTFDYSSSIELQIGEDAKIEMTVRDDFEQVDLFLEDSLLKSWSHPKGKISYQLKTSNQLVGAKNLSLVSRDGTGREYIDSRIFRVLSDVKPQKMVAKIVQSFPHNPQSFTQGLEFNEGQLYESTGQKGSSQIAEVDLETGVIGKKIGLDATYFGEGITILNNKIYQLTWQEQKCFVYDKKSLQIQTDFRYQGEGWGICNNGKHIIMSDGSERITFRDPSNFNPVRIIEVYDHLGPRDKLNELEYIGGKIYANVWMSDLILVIDPATGKVIAEIDCSAIAVAGRGNGEVLNGIAYNTLTNKTYLTGKNWDRLIEVTFE